MPRRKITNITGVRSGNQRFISSIRRESCLGYVYCADTMREDLTEDDKYRIMTAFSEEVVPKLKKLSARIGTLNCAFVGPQYRNWLIHFRETRSDFEITEFEYDEDSRDLDLKVLV